MYQAITTKYLGPTNIRGSRVKATTDAGSITLHWDDALNPWQNHARAAEALARKLGWSGDYHGGAVGSGYVFVSSSEPAFSVSKIYDDMTPAPREGSLGPY